MIQSEVSSKAEGPALPSVQSSCTAGEQGSSRAGAWEWDILADRSIRSPIVDEILGFEAKRYPPELNGYLAVIHADDRSRVDEIVQAAVATRRPFEVLYRALGPDGHVRWIENRADVLLDEEGRPARYVGMIADVTGRMQAAEALRESERRLRELVDLLPAAIYLTDAAGRITFYNEAAAELAGNRPKLGSDKWCVSWRLFWPDGTPLPHDECPMAISLKEGRAVRGVEAVLERPDGTRVPFIPYPTPLYDDFGMLIGAVNLLVDVSDRKAAESKVEELNARLRRAMSETHHRVKNNLQVISAMIDMQCMSEALDAPRAEMQKLGTHIRSMAAIHDLLTQRTRKDLESDSMSAGEVIERILPMLRTLMQGRNLFAESEDIPVPLRHGSSLAILVNELVSNAVKHGREDVSVCLKRDGDGALLEVYDNGPGFPDGFDVEAAAHTGLELVEQVARWDLQGTVRYENRPDGGAKVAVSFPLSISRKASTESP